MLCTSLSFFSSRRRHTRCLSDWSSDVCSSDLTVRRHPRAGADLHPPGLGAGAMAFPLSCRPSPARHLGRRSGSYCALGAGVGPIAAENPKADLEIPYHGPTQRWSAQLCIGPAAVLGDSRVASRRRRSGRWHVPIVSELPTIHSQSVIGLSEVLFS